MSIRGRPSRWFEQAVRRGDLAGALGEASELALAATLPALAVALRRRVRAGIARLEAGR